MLPNKALEHNHVDQLRILTASRTVGARWPCQSVLVRTGYTKGFVRTLLPPKRHCNYPLTLLYHLGVAQRHGFGIFMIPQKQMKNSDAINQASPFDRRLTS